MPAVAPSEELKPKNKITWDCHTEIAAPTSISLGNYCIIAESTNEILDITYSVNLEYEEATSQNLSGVYC